MLVKFLVLCVVLFYWVFRGSFFSYAFIPCFWEEYVTRFARSRGVVQELRRHFGGKIMGCHLVRSNSGVLVNLSNKGSSLTLLRLLTEHSHVLGPGFAIVTIRMNVAGVPCRSSLRCLGNCSRSLKIPFIRCRAFFSPDASAQGSPYFLYS